METQLLIGAVVALAGPWLLWGVEQILPFPSLIEEVFKLVLIWWGWKASGLRLSSLYLLLLGVGFGASETILYLFNALQSGETELYWLRLVTTVPMHMVTVVVIGWGFRARSPWVGFVLAIMLHTTFNWVVRGV